MVAKEIGLATDFRSLGIDQQQWLDHVDEIAMLAFEDQCSPANPRVPLVKDMVEILKEAY